MLWDAFKQRMGVDEPTMRDTVLAISRIPYGRPSSLSAEGVIRDWRGTCSTKHVLLWSLLSAHWPESAPSMWHRIYRVWPDHARAIWGESVAGRVPPDGLIDIHSYLSARIAGNRVAIDATFAVDDWDGRTSMHVWAAAGHDIPAGADPLGCKRALEREHCDPSLREPFIAAIVRADSLRT